MPIRTRWLDGCIISGDRDILGIAFFLLDGVMQMRPLIEFCINNLTADVLEVKQTLEKDPSLDVLEYGCLGNCGICARQPYALVDGELVSAETAEELLEKIWQKVEETEFRF
jgi:uncharacterized protein YuzB (UPF0349 family)